MVARDAVGLPHRGQDRGGLAALAGLGVVAALFAAPTAASAAGAQYCIASSGANGSDSYVGNCVYAQYEACLQAAAQTRGRCVANIDYSSTAPQDTRRARRAR